MDNLSSPELSPTSIPSVGRFTNPSKGGSLDDPFAPSMDMLSGANTSFDDSIEGWQQSLMDDQQFPVAEPEEETHVEMLAPVDTTNSNAEMVDALSVGALHYHYQAYWSTMWPRYMFAPPFNHQQQAYWPTPIPCTHNPGVSDLGLMDLNGFNPAPALIPAWDSFSHYMQPQTRPYPQHCFGCQSCPTDLSICFEETCHALPDMYLLPGHDLALLGVEPQYLWNIFLGAGIEEVLPLAQDGELPYPGPS